jgi:hypothetical protein
MGLVYPWLFRPNEFCSDFFCPSIGGTQLKVELAPFSNYNNVMLALFYLMRHLTFFSAKIPSAGFETSASGSLAKCRISVLPKLAMICRISNKIWSSTSWRFWYRPTATESTKSKVIFRKQNREGRHSVFFGGGGGRPKRVITKVIKGTN